MGDLKQKVGYFFLILTIIWSLFTLSWGWQGFSFYIARGNTGAIWAFVIFFIGPCIVGAILSYVLLKKPVITDPPDSVRYQNLLKKLETKYRRGGVNTKIYNKLRKEYRAKIGVQIEGSKSGANIWKTRGGYSALSAGILNIITFMLLGNFQWSMPLFYGIMGVITSILLALLGLGLYFDGQLLDFRLKKISGIISVLLGVGVFLVGAAQIDYYLSGFRFSALGTFLTSVISITPVYLPFFGYLSILDLLLLLWYVVTGYVFIKIGYTQKKTIAILCGSVLIASFALYFLIRYSYGWLPPISVLPFGTSLTVVGVTLLKSLDKDSID